MHDFDPSIMQDFLTESGELLEKLERDLVELESSPANPDLLGAVFRALHTIKGSASFLQLPNLVELTHAAESALGAARDGEIQIDRNTFDLLLASVDHLRLQLTQLGAGEEQTAAADPELIESLTGLALKGLASESITGQEHTEPGREEPSGGDEPTRAKGESTSTVAPSFGAGERSIRVDVDRLETLMNLVGELVLQKNRIGALIGQASRAVDDPQLAESLKGGADALERVTGEIQLEVMRTRLQALDKLFGRYPRFVRELASKTGKQINLVIEGGQAEADRSVIEALADPLMHLLRNCADHGIEDPLDRAVAGKDMTGTITISAAHEGSHVRVRVSDDGRGLDRDRIGRAAIERGLVTSEALAGLSDSEVYRFILEPGFSTATEVSELSGRGVGMDVVRTNIEHTLRGSVSIRSIKDKGTTVSITIPLTVAIMPAMMIEVGDEIMAVPLRCIREIVQLDPGMRADIAGNPIVSLRDGVCPLISAQRVFETPEHLRRDETMAMVLRVGEHRAALAITRVIGQQEIVIKPLPCTRRQGPISGATVRSDGGVSLIIDTEALIHTTRRATQRHATR